jgi:hypothetical protein
MSGYQIQKVNDWHQALADFIIQYPQARNKEIAHHFQVSVQWVGMIRRSDAFQELMRSRREVHRELVSASVINKVEALADQAIDEISRQMEQGNIPIEHVKDVAAMSLKAMGFGGDKSGPAVVNNTVVVADREALAEARAKLIAQRDRLVETRPLLDAQVIRDAKETIEERKKDN